MNGDWLYEELRVYPPEAWRLVQGLSEFPRIVDVMPTIVGVGENVTIDQYAADHVVGLTRFPTLTIGSESGIHGGCQLS